jgi:hypothetical protein
MNLNIITYIIFFTVVTFITVKVGWVFYKNGEHFIHNLIPDDLHLVQAINKMLLVGYYLLNIGYAAIVLSMWNEVLSIEQMISSLGEKAGSIIMGLGVIHYINMTTLTLYQKIKDQVTVNTSKTKI